ncbi:predicted protein [Sclerotinia sclerotiorum 1980 UF-70]|uniref:Uncharacterized protein n=1 Tax=Sclerotinia sclerotiorum (strain ATCC 18683 / 1980 / Ss-1) TaxID=665079 RepID=A7EJX7_SCLS1|nr:predicted protein [Sclerotinia sclerotiorum 1980 UF-70]EDO03143.1 predicted protein [Sclerotinia sclerotiorum 1980 UF-70]
MLLVKNLEQKHTKQALISFGFQRPLLKQNIDEHPKWQEVHMEVEEIWFRLGDTVKKWNERVEVELGVGRWVE